MHARAISVRLPPRSAMRRPSSLTSNPRSKFPRMPSMAPSAVRERDSAPGSETSHASDGAAACFRKNPAKGGTRRRAFDFRKARQGLGGGHGVQEPAPRFGQVTAEPLHVAGFDQMVNPSEPVPHLGTVHEVG